MQTQIFRTILILIAIIFVSGLSEIGQAQTRPQRTGENTTRDRLLQEYLNKQDKAEQEKLLEDMKIRGQMERSTADYTSPEMYQDSINYPLILYRQDQQLYYG